MEEITTRRLREMIWDHEYRIQKEKDPDKIKLYEATVNIYREELSKREKKMHDDFMSHVDENGYWISKKIK